jgi:hypothetical protein
MLLEDDEIQYNSKWSRLMHEGRGEAIALSQYITESFGEAVDELDNRRRRDRPKVMQEHSSIDVLFEDVELVDVAFQELVQCWLKVAHPMKHTPLCCDHFSHLTGQRQKRTFKICARARFERFYSFWNGRHCLKVPSRPGETNHPSNFQNH